MGQGAGRNETGLGRNGPGVRKGTGARRIEQEWGEMGQEQGGLGEE